MLVGSSGCSDDPPGLTLDFVPSDPSTVHVRLLISDDTCSNCPGIGPDTGGVNMNPAVDIVPGTVRLLQDSGPPSDDVIDVLDNGAARFRLLPNPQPTGQPTTIVALGLDGEGVPLEMGRIVLDPVPDRTYEQVALGPIEGRVAIWPDDGTYTCVEIDGITDDPQGTEFYVPRTDKDCDRLRDEDDCQPLDYLFVAPQTAPPGVATCAVDTHVDGNQGCFLGAGGECSDGGSDTGTCSALMGPPTCAPSSFCEDPCKNAASADQCANGSTSSITCTIVVVDGGVACDISTFDFGSQTCSTFDVASFDLSPGINLNGFSSIAKLRDASNQEIADMAVVPLPDGAAGCGDEGLEFTGAPNTGKGGAWVRMHLDHADAIVPIFVTFNRINAADCAAATSAMRFSTCSLQIGADDSLATCGKN